MQRLIKYFILVSGSLFLLIISLATIVYFQLPSVQERSKTYVMGVPSSQHQQFNVSSYSGKHPRLKSRPAEIVEFPIPVGDIGPVEPLFAGQNRYPFFCGKNKINKAQPIIDNHSKLGVPVYAEKANKLTDDVVGYSKDCSHHTHASYYYNRKNSKKFYPLHQADNDIATIELEGRRVDFIVRLETGTINRYFYGVAALKGDGSLARPSSLNWNKRLIYQFRGGVGIGTRQGNIKSSDLLNRRYDEIKKGYAVVYSTANQTSNHYNIWLAEDTALRLKKQFVALYDEPDYTVGIGGSGGAIQQYLLAQNNPDIINAAIPLYSYPDMVTQTTYVMDCEPLEYYFDVTDRDNKRWGSWKNRSLVEGMNGAEKITNKFSYLSFAAAIFSGNAQKITRGSSECVQGWRGLMPVVHNPKFIHFSKNYRRKIAKSVHWTHWDDLKKFYGIDQYGYANSTWDNVGVQYGLKVLRSGQLSVEEFLKINARIGGWKPFHKMEQEKYWLMQGKLFPVDFSQWSHHNMTQSADGGNTPARRTLGSLAAMQGAYQSGHVFLGYADIPIVDLRHYLEDELDMHHSTASFASRERMLKGQGHADNQLIWMSAKPYTPIPAALDLIYDWMRNIHTRPQLSVAENKPNNAKDSCFDEHGKVIAAGNNVWDGDWNSQPKGQCSTVFPRYKTSREVAGEGVAGDVFKCQLQSVARAIKQGAYGVANISTYQARLEMIFPEGVCDYSKPDMGLPSGNWFPMPELFETKTIKAAKNLTRGTTDSVDFRSFSMLKN